MPEEIGRELERGQALPRRGPRPKVTTAKLHRLHQMRAQGNTVREICAELSIAQPTYYAWLAKMASDASISTSCQSAWIP
jgi:hypothetical protein